MKNIIFNSTDENVTIDVIGDIGESFFSEGITTESFKNSLDQHENKDVTLNIASLGGNVFDALAIYDMLKNHKGMVISNIMGATASAGTIIAMGGDEVKISDNSLFLIHNVSSMVAGGAEEMEKQAETMRKIDNQLNKIYRKKTGKSEAFVRNLMNEDKWITAAEAKQYGFVDTVIKSVKNISTAIYNKINESDLPKITNTNNKMKQFELINKIIGVESLEDTYLNEAQMEAIVAEITAKEGLISTVNAEKDALAAKIVTNETEIQALKDEAKTASESTGLLITEKDAKIAELTAQVKDLETKAVVAPIEAKKVDLSEATFLGKPLSDRAKLYIQKKLNQ